MFLPCTQCHYNISEYNDYNRQTEWCVHDRLKITVLNWQEWNLMWSSAIVAHPAQGWMFCISRDAFSAHHVCKEWLLTLQYPTWQFNPVVILFRGLLSTSVSGCRTSTHRDQSWIYHGHRHFKTGQTITWYLYSSGESGSMTDLDSCSLFDKMEAWCGFLLL